MVRRRIPHPEVPKEVRQGFQHLTEDLSILTDGTSGQLLVGAGVGSPAAWTDQSAIDHGGFGGLSDDHHTIYLLADGTRNLTGNLTVDAAITIDGRDLSVDGAKLDGIEALADVTDATNVAAAGAAMSGGAFHDGFSDFVANEHIDHVDYLPSLTNDNAGSIVIGQAVYSSGADSVDLARANDSTTSEVIGLVADASIASSASGQIRTVGILTATTAQWDAVAGTTGGLTQGAVYYLSDAVAGGLVETTVSKPGSFLVRIGVALSTTEMRLVIGTISPAEPAASTYIDTDTTLYITTSGNDTTGDGTSGSPWATLSKALEWLADKLISASATITIQIGDGTYNWTSTDEITHINGERINIVGQNTYDLTLSSIQSSSGSAGAWAVIINVNDVSNAAVDDYLLIPYNVSGGTRPETLCGCWIITNVDAVNTRLTVTSTNQHTAAPSGAVSGTVTLVKTIIEYDGCDGISIAENGKLGLIEKLVVKGTGSDDGIIVGGQGFCRGGDDLGVVSFDRNIVSEAGGHFVCDYVISSSGASGIRVYFATARAPWGVFSGCTDTGISCDTADVILNGVVACGNTSYGIRAEACCNLSPTSATAKVTYNQGYGIRAHYNSFVNANGATLSNNVTDDADPNVNTLGNVESYIRN